MSTKKEELISGVELAKRLNISSAFISKEKKAGRFKGCIHNKKYYFERSCRALGRNPENIQTSHQTNTQKKVTSKATDKKTTIKDTPKVKVVEKKEIKKEIKKEDPKPKEKTPPIKMPSSLESKKDRVTIEKYLQNAIHKAIADKSYDKFNLDGLVNQLKLLKEFQLMEQEKIKLKKLEDNLFERDEVMQILSFSFNAIRNSLLNLPNNYAVNLDGLSQKEIKDYVADDINKILLDFQRVEEKLN